MPLGHPGEMESNLASVELHSWSGHTVGLSRVGSWAEERKGVRKTERVSGLGRQSGSGSNGREGSHRLSDAPKKELKASTGFGA